MLNVDNARNYMRWLCMMQYFSVTDKRRDEQDDSRSGELRLNRIESNPTETTMTFSSVIDLIQCLYQSYTFLTLFSSSDLLSAGRLSDGAKNTPLPQ